MKRFFEHRGLSRKNIVTLIGIGLFFYFSYHLIQGQRSAMRYLTLEQTISRMEQQKEELKSKREDLETKVAMLRPNSINKDLLEERARIVLGFRKTGEMDVLNGDVH
jgi:cell division protein FtsB